MPRQHGKEFAHNLINSISVYAVKIRSAFLVDLAFNSKTISLPFEIDAFEIRQQVLVKHVV